MKTGEETSNFNSSAKWFFLTSFSFKFSLIWRLLKRYHNKLEFSSWFLYFLWTISSHQMYLSSIYWMQKFFFDLDWVYQGFHHLYKDFAILPRFIMIHIFPFLNCLKSEKKSPIEVVFLINFLIHAGQLVFVTSDFLTRIFMN